MKKDEFRFGGAGLGFDLDDYWRWGFSDLLSNVNRGVLAEFIVARALGVDTSATPRDAWREFDLETSDGSAVEVKSSAYEQSWKQAEPSRISFDVAPKRRWDSENGEWSGPAQRWSDVYVFCLLGTPSEVPNPLELEQWRFLAAATSALNTEIGDQKSIALAPLKEIAGEEVMFNDISGAVRVALAESG